ncbi:MAG: J domain-containing protein [Sulfurospirillum sp.]
MKKDSLALINDALDTLELPVLISIKELKQRYKILASTYHPDLGGDSEKMAKINDAYRLLKNYMDNFKFSFTKEEIYKQFPQDDYVSRFRF